LASLKKVLSDAYLPVVLISNVYFFVTGRATDDGNGK
jgi:hypothetical protein